MSFLHSFASMPAIDTRTIGEIEQEIVDELETHILMRADEYVRDGMQPCEAREAAAAQFGNFEQILGECRRTLLGERIMMQRLQAALTLVLLAAVGWLAYRVHVGQRATETALSDFSAAVQKVTEPATPASDWRKDRPVVVDTFPKSGATDVDPNIVEIRVTFSKQMADHNWSWVQDSEHSFPEGSGDVHYLDDGKTCVKDVKLKPNTKYVVWINSANYQNFKDREGRPADPYLLTFTTRLQ